MDHADLVAEMHTVENLPTQDRLHLARMRRAQQLKVARQKEKEWQKIQNRRDKLQQQQQQQHHHHHHHHQNSHSNKKTSQLPRHISFENSVVLLEAAGRNDIDEVAQLLQKGITPDASNEDGLTALHQCCIDNNVEMLKLLLNYGANVDAQDSDKWTPLHAAATCGHLNLVKILINSGANLLAVNTDGNMPYDLCDDEETLDYIEAEMSKRGVTQELIDDTRALTERQMLSDLIELTNNGGDLEESDSQGATPLHIAAANGYTSVVEFLLEHHVNVDAVDKDLWSPVHAAACWGHLEVLEMLAQYGANLDAKNKDDETPSDICEDAEIRERIEQLRSEQESKRLAEAQRRRVRRSQSNNTRAQSVRRTSLRDKTLTTKKDAVEETRLRLQAQEVFIGPETTATETAIKSNGSSGNNELTTFLPSSHHRKNSDQSTALAIVPNNNTTSSEHHHHGIKSNNRRSASVSAISLGETTNVTIPPPSSSTSSPSIATATIGKHTNSRLTSSQKLQKQSSDSELISSNGNSNKMSSSSSSVALQQSTVNNVVNGSITNNNNNYRGSVGHNNSNSNNNNSSVVGSYNYNSFSNNGNNSNNNDNNHNSNTWMNGPISHNDGYHPINFNIDSKYQQSDVELSALTSSSASKFLTNSRRPPEGKDSEEFSIVRDKLVNGHNSYSSNSNLNKLTNDSSSAEIFTTNSADSAKINVQVTVLVDTHNLDNGLSGATLASLKKQRSLSRSSAITENGSVITATSQHNIATPIQSSNTITASGTATTAAATASLPLSTGGHQSIELSVGSLKDSTTIAPILSSPSNTNVVLTAAAAASPSSTSSSLLATGQDQLQIKNRFSGRTSDVVGDSTRSRKCCMLM